MKVVVEEGNLTNTATLALLIDRQRYIEALETADPTAEQVSGFLLRRLRMQYGADPKRQDEFCVYGAVFAMDLEALEQGEPTIETNLFIRPKTSDRKTKIHVAG